MIINEAERLAKVLNFLRPDWPTTSLKTWLMVNMSEYSWQDAATVAVNCVCDPATETPARILERGPWWNTIRPAMLSLEQSPPPYYQRNEAREDEYSRAEYGEIGTRGAAAVRQALKAARSE